MAGFRIPHAREYFETLPVPPPSTVYGMLLSLVGEEDRCRHQGAELAIAILSQPALSVVLRTTWRIKDKKQGPGMGSNRRPDFQELLSGLRLAIWLRPGREAGTMPSLFQRVGDVLANPAASRRFGALALGESTHLVDELRPLRHGDLTNARPLLADTDGDLSLTLWPNHVGSKGTVWGQYRLAKTMVGDTPLEQAWITIRRAEQPGSPFPEGVP
ncbi:fruiting body developmental protein S-like protein [Candidatus Accumulibacter phosphatis]|uniref:Fruiting body developmental protein S-like protein n=1 Tax=Candidatus Accumulibacter phosphatis TaxID=327160 RepID=A0A5S4F6T8_9PROT|nr:fruiting body developmental protein S-like protein [Candidatus Accumulibacter phosphatis]